MQGSIRRTRALSVFAIIAAACAPGAAARQGPERTPGEPAREAFIESLLARMTLEEKLGQLNQPPSQWGQTGPIAPPGSEDQIRRGEIGSFLSVYGAEYTGRLQRIAVEEARLGIPLLFGYDVIHGFRTIFPVPLAEASSWNPEAVRRAAEIAAAEGAAHGIHWTYAPMVDVARDPRWGRIVEGSGEDPYLGSALAVARVRGFQGDDLSSPATLAATAKHFAAYGAAQAGRDYNPADISERTLREVYLPPFHAAVCAGVATLMAGFNEIGGVPAHASRLLMTDILRGEWGFDGLVVSDYTGVQELLQHGVAATRGEAGKLALEAGVDVDMVSAIYVKDLPALVREGRVPERLVDAAVRRVLRLKWDLGLFSDPYRYSDPAREQALTLTNEIREVAREVARQSIVLLKNDPVPGGPGQEPEAGILPLRRDLGTIAVIGPLADDARSAIGNWAAAGRAEDAVDVLQGIRRAAAPGTTILHARGVDAASPDTAGIGDAAAAAARADVAILVIGETQEMSAEASSRATIGLPGRQADLAHAVQATGTPVVVVLMNGRPLAIPSLVENVPAVVESWYLGVEMGNAVADVLFGGYNPGGKLPVTFPRSTGQVPIYYAHRNTGRPPSPREKYTSKYLDVPWTPLFPFGYGLSYTRFSYGPPRLGTTTLRPGGSLAVQVEVTNSGTRMGHEVVQLYIRDEVASVTRPVKELRGFERIRLEPGESRTVTFEVELDDLAFWNQEMRRVAEPGHFTVYVGSSSEEVQEARFELVTRDGPVDVPVSCARPG